MSSLYTQKINYRPKTVYPSKLSLKKKGKRKIILDENWVDHQET